MEAVHARKTKQWRKVKCDVSGAREGQAGGEKVSGVLPVQQACFIKSAGWATDIKQNNSRNLEDKKQNCQQNDHNSIIIQIVLSELIVLTFSFMTELSAEVASPLRLHSVT